MPSQPESTNQVKGDWRLAADRAYPNMTDRARHVLLLADEYATEMGHYYIGTEHILVGLVREGGGIAAGVFESLGVQRDKIETAVESIVGRGKPNA